MPQPPTTSASEPATNPAPPGRSHAPTGCGIRACSKRGSFRSMTQPILNVLAVVGSLNPNSSTRSVINHVVGHLKAAGCAVDVLDLLGDPLPLFNPDSAHATEGVS